MRKFGIVMMLSMTLLTLVSCNSSVAEKDKYPVDDYLSKGAKLEGYEADGTAVLKDIAGNSFYVGKCSAYKVQLDDKGIIISTIIVGDKSYYLSKGESVSTLPENVSKAKISVLVDKELKPQERSLKVYENNENSNEVYLLEKDAKTYTVWKSIE